MKFEQRLTPEQEDSLVDWIIDEDTGAQPPSHGCVCEMVLRILRMNGDHKSFDCLWVTNFLRRDLSVVKEVRGYTDG